MWAAVPTAALLIVALGCITALGLTAMALLMDRGRGYIENEIRFPGFRFTSKRHILESPRKEVKSNKKAKTAKRRHRQLPRPRGRPG